MKYITEYQHPTLIINFINHIKLIIIIIMQLRKAQRRQAKIKLALQGVSGSGKTMSALLLASGITE